MNYHEFQTTILKMVRERITEGWMPGAAAVTKMLTKNNGMEVCGLFIRKEGETLAPAIYLESYYDMFLAGQDMGHILDLICRRYESAGGRMPVKMSSPENFEEVKPFIIYRIVNLERNKELLRSCPCVPLLDLAVTFRWLVLSDEDSISSAMITNEQMDFWGLDVKDLLELARINTSRLFPAQIRPMAETVYQMCSMYEGFEDTDESFFLTEPDRGTSLPMYILSNKKGINGATCMIYENVLKDFARRLEEGFYILPSSIHELILVPESWVEDPAELSVMVREVNEAIVPLDEILSDSVYHFDREKNSLELAVCA